MGKIIRGIIATDHVDSDGDIADVASLDTSAVGSPDVHPIEGPGVPVRMGHRGPIVGRTLRTWKGRLPDGHKALFGEFELSDDVEVPHAMSIFCSPKPAPITTYEGHRMYTDMNLRHVALTDKPGNVHARVEGVESPPEAMRRWVRTDLAHYVGSLLASRPEPIRADTAEQVELVSRAYLEHARLTTIGDKPWPIEPPKWVERTLPWQDLSAGQAEEFSRWSSRALFAAMRAEVLGAVADVVRSMQRPASRPPADRIDADQVDVWGEWLHVG